MTVRPRSRNPIKNSIAKWPERGRMAWREPLRKKPSGPAQAHTEWRKKVQLESLTKYDLYKMSDGSEHSESEFYYPMNFPIMNFWNKQVITKQNFCRMKA